MKQLVTKRQLTAHVASKELGRYAPNAINFTPDGAVSTDGRCLMVVPNDPGAILDEFPEEGVQERPADDKPALIPTKVAERVAKDLPKHGQRPVLEMALLQSEGGKISLQTTDLETVQEQRGRELEAQFPDYRAVILPAGGRTVRLNLEVLEKLVKAAKKADGEAIQLSFPDENWEEKSPGNESADLSYGSGIRFEILPDCSSELGPENAYGCLMPINS